MIGPKTIEQAKRLTNELLDTYQNIKEAYVKAEGGVSVGLTLKITPDDSRAGFVYVDAQINFVESRVKDSVVVSICENQDPLFMAIEKLCPKKGSGIDSVTISNPRRGMKLR